MKIDNFSDEFFYDSTFDDYERNYIMRFLMNDIKSEFVIIPSVAYIMSHRPLDMGLKLSDVIGMYYPMKDSKGIYGHYKLIKSEYEPMMEYATLSPHGLYTIENEVPVNYRLYCVCFELKQKIDEIRVC